MTRPLLTRRALLAGALAAVAAPAALRAFGPARPERARTEAYEALVEALLDHGSLPGEPSEARAATDRLALLHADALPARRVEIDATLDALVRGKLTSQTTAERVNTLRGWAAAGGERRATAARACALAGAAFGPANHPLPVLI